MELLWTADSEIDVTLLGNKSELYIVCVWPGRVLWQQIATDAH